jgi:protein-L-isoaspartate(D-aspartate) O-methyltransferase
MTDYAKARLEMVERLEKEGYIKDPRVKAALNEVERHKFVPTEVRSRAYFDCPQPIGLDQTISAPHMIAIMSELLDVQPESNILEIGCGSGYQAAVLAHLAPQGKIVTVERLEELLERAQKVIKKLGYDNIIGICADGTLGVPEYAPYNRIIVTAAAPEVPQHLVDQLDKGGKMLIPVGNRWGQTLIELNKDMRGDVSGRSHGGCIFVPLIGENGWPQNHQLGPR